MIKHIVMWRLKEHALGHDKAHNGKLIKQQLEAMNGALPGILKLEVGADILHIDASADLVLYSEFESQAALDAYQHFPTHVETKDFIGQVADERVVVDYEI